MDDYGDDYSDYGSDDYSFDDIGSSDVSYSDDYEVVPISDFGQEPSYDWGDNVYDNQYWDASSDNSYYQPVQEEVPMYGYGGYQDLGIGNPGSYGGVTVLPEYAQDASGGYGTGFLDTLDSIGSFIQSPGGQALGGLLGAGISYADAQKRNKLQKQMAKKQEEALAKRQVEAARYNEPLRLNYERKSVEAPKARKGETVFFTGNQLPSYFADGGAVGGLENIRRYAKGRNIDEALQEAEGYAPQPAPAARSMGSQADAWLAETERMEREGLEEARRRAREVSGKKKRFLFFAEGGCAPGYVRGGQPGQSDVIDARLSPGEYVFDADVVSAIGDGNNEAGAALLDAMRSKIRTHKRSSPSSKIPPKARSPLAYLKGVKNGR